MAKNNIKLLTDIQLDKFNEKYWFDYDEQTDEVIVRLYFIDRITRHPASEPFSINSKIRKVNFTVKAIELWKQIRTINKKATLFDVQQAVNKAIITYQTLDISNILRLINNPDIKIKSEGAYL